MWVEYTVTDYRLFFYFFLLLLHLTSPHSHRRVRAVDCQPGDVTASDLLDDGLGRQSATTGYVTRYCRSRILIVCIFSQLLLSFVIVTTANKG